MVVARSELGASFQEGLLQARGVFYCATQANVFWVKGNTLVTPLLDVAGVHGVMRAEILEWAQQHNYRLIEAKVSPKQLADFDECFLSNSLYGVIAVNHIAVDPSTRVDYKHHSFAKQYYQHFLTLV